MTNDRTIRLHRVLPTKPEKIYKAFVDADAKARWLPPNGFTCKVHNFDPKVGGAYKMSFANFTTGNSHSWTGKFVELVPGERIVYADKFDDPNMPGEMVVTVTLAWMLPPVYVAEPRLAVESEQIPDELAASTVQVAATEQLQIIEQRILTRDTLIEMANRLQSYAPAPGQPSRRLEPDEIVEDLRERISIVTTGGAQSRGTAQATIVRWEGYRAQG